jgi:glutamine cyclotransferase
VACSDLPVLAEYPHDDSAFTQGLVHDTSTGTFYESTGLYGRSSVRRVAPSTGEVIASRPLDASYFGEGLALWNRTLYQLTWR